MRCAVVGHPVAHSRTPVLYAAAFNALGLDWTMTAVDVPPGGLPGFVRGLDATWRGLAVTMPHKTAVVSLGCPDETVTLLGVGNTLVLGDAPAVHNTDVSGFRRALEYRGVTAVREVLLLGAGATARAALLALAGLEVGRVTAQVRDLTRADDWLGLARTLDVAAGVELLGTPHPCDLVISTLPPRAADEWVEAVVAGAGAVFDVAYDPWPTALGVAGERAGLPVVSGLDLLVGQAVQQLVWLTGEVVDMTLLTHAAHSDGR